MAAYDLFGLKKGLPAPADPVHDAPPPKPGLGRKAWLGLAVADGLLVLACLAVLAVRVKGHLNAPPLPPPAPPRHLAGKTGSKPPEAKPAETKPEPPKPEVKKPEPEAKKPEPPKREAKKPEPAKHEKKAPPHKEEAKGPVGSPAVNAEPLPKREAVPTGTAPARPSLAPAKAGAKKRLTRPVPFTHEDAKAKEVYLVGPFLVRTGGRKTLFKDSKGVWQTTIYLNIGQTYKYRFEVVSESGTKKLTPAQKVEVLDGD